MKKDKELLNYIHKSGIKKRDIEKFSKRKTKKYLQEYRNTIEKICEIKKVNDSKIEKKEVKKQVYDEEDIEVLDFTRTINIKEEELIEFLDFTREYNLSDLKDLDKVKKETKKRILKKRIFWVIVLFFSLIFIFILLNIIFRDKKDENKTTDVIKIVNKYAINTASRKEEKKEKTLYEIYNDDSMIDFKSLKEINNDVKGWITLNGTNINYPFVQTNNNEYYLKHSFDKTANKKGWVFLDFRNDINNLSYNTILYAHGLDNNQMFGSIRKVFKRDWTTNKLNHYITLKTDNKEYIWQVFSTYQIEPESFYIKTDFSGNVEFKTFLDTIKSRSFYDYKTEVLDTDRIITLSSCYDNKKRMVVHAKLISN